MQSESPQSQSPKQKVLCSFGADVTQGAVRPFEYQSLRAFAGWLKNLPAVREKITANYIVGATFESSKRTLTAMRGATIIQLDFDSPASADQRGAVCAALENLNIGFVCMDSFSNGGKFVVLIPLAHPASPAEHRATMEYVVGELGLYAAGLDPASYNPVLPRFVSPNANSPEREITLHDGPFIVPVAAKEGTLPANVANIAPIPPKQDRFALYTSQGEPEHKELFLVALRNKLLPTDRCDNYNRWFPVLFAGFRAWAINSRDLTESQRVLMEALNVWSAGDPKYRKGCVEIKLNDWLRDGDTGQKLHIHSLLSHEIDSGRLRTAINEDNDLDLDQKIALIRALDKLVGTPVITVIDEQALLNAASQRVKEAEELATTRLMALTSLARMPAPTARFAEFREILTALVTQGQAEHWELSHDEWPYFLRPAPMLIGLMQIISMGFAPHVMFKVGGNAPPKALNLYFMNIGRAGTGKSVGISELELILRQTVFKNSTCETKLHSATGLWTNFFEQRGNIQLVFSEEAESLIGKGKPDQHLAGLHTMVKTMFDQGVPGRKYRPSAQVQREIRELNAPWMALHLAATPMLLQHDMSDAMLNDGFMSRVIVSIDERDMSLRSKEDAIAAKLALMRAKPTGTDLTIHGRAVAFMNNLWRDSGHPGGREFFSMMPDADLQELTANIVSHFETTGIIRLMRYAERDEERFAELLFKAEDRWQVPPSARDTEIGANVGSLRARAETKLNVMASLLTLIADPKATEINYELAVWAEEFLYYTQLPFYNHIINQTEVITSLSPKFKSNEDAINKLVNATREGGPLFTGKCSSTELNKFSAYWRVLLRDLKLPKENPKRVLAEDLLKELEVAYKDGEHNSRTFYYTKGVDL